MVFGHRRKHAWFACGAAAGGSAAAAPLSGSEKFKQFNSMRKLQNESRFLYNAVSIHIYIERESETHLHIYVYIYI